MLMKLREIPDEIKFGTCSQGHEVRMVAWVLQGPGYTLESNMLKGAHVWADRASQERRYEEEC